MESATAPQQAAAPASNGGWSVEPAGADSGSAQPAPTTAAPDASAHASLLDRIADAWHGFRSGVQEGSYLHGAGPSETQRVVNTGAAPTPTPLPVVSAPIEGVPQAARGVKHLVTGQGGRANAAADVIEGGLKTAEPMILGAAPEAYPEITAGLGAGAAAQVGTQATLNRYNVGSDAQRRLAGDVMGLVAGGIGAKAAADIPPETYGWLAGKAHVGTVEEPQVQAAMKVNPARFHVTPDGQVIDRQALLDAVREVANGQRQPVRIQHGAAEANPGIAAPVEPPVERAALPPAPEYITGAPRGAGLEQPLDVNAAPAPEPTTPAGIVLPRNLAGMERDLPPRPAASEASGVAPDLQTNRARALGVRLPESREVLRGGETVLPTSPTAPTGSGGWTVEPGAVGAETTEPWVTTPFKNEGATIAAEPGAPPQNVLLPHAPWEMSPLELEGARESARLHDQQRVAYLTRTRPGFNVGNPTAAEDSYLGGFREPGAREEGEAKEFLDAAQAAENARTPEELSQDLARSLTELGDLTDPAKGNLGQQLAYYRLKVGFQRAEAEGWDVDDVFKGALKAAASQFSDPKDAEFMLRRFLRGAEPQAAPAGDATPKATGAALPSSPAHLNADVPSAGEDEATARLRQAALEDIADKLPQGVSHAASKLGTQDLNALAVSVLHGGLTPEQAETALGLYRAASESVPEGASLHDAIRAARTSPQDIVRRAEGEVADATSDQRQRPGELAPRSIPDAQARLRAARAMADAHEAMNGALEGAAGENPIARKRIVSEDAYNRAKANVRGMVGQLNSGIPIDRIPDLLTIAAYHLENGARTFADWSGRMVGQFGDAIKPHLQGLWDRLNAPPQEPGGRAGHPPIAPTPQVDQTATRAAARTIQEPAAVAKVAPQSVLGRAAAAIDRIRSLPEWTTYRDIIGHHLGNLDRSVVETDRDVKAMRKAVPKLDRREAITRYIEAAGDEGTLQRQAAEAQQAGSAKAARQIRDAMTLTDAEKAVAADYRVKMDSLLKAGQNAEALGEGLDNYVRHTWKPRAADADKIEARASGGADRGVLNTNLDAAKKRFYGTIHDGEMAGLQPQSTDFADLYGRYRQALMKAISSREAVYKLAHGSASDGRPLVLAAGSARHFGGDVDAPVLVNPNTMPSGRLSPPDIKHLGQDGLDRLVSNGQIEPSTDANGRPSFYWSTKGYRQLDSPALRSLKLLTRDSGGEPVYLNADAYVHPEVYDHLKNILQPDSFARKGAFRAVLKGSRELKQSLLSLSPFHYVQEGLRGVQGGINPFSPPDIDTANPDLRDLMDHGLLLRDHGGHEHYSEGLTSHGGLLGKVPGFGHLNNAIADHLFKDYIPRLKAASALHDLARFRKAYPDASPDELYQAVANKVNANFGGLNYKAMGRAASTQDAARLFLLAPDWFESELRSAGNAFGKFGAPQRADIARMVAYTYGVARVLNLINTGHLHPEHPFGVVSQDGKKVYTVRTLPGDILHAGEDPRGFLFNRTNPLLTRTAMEGFTGRDQLGRERTMRQQLGDLARQVVPISAQGIPGVNNRTDESWWQSLSRSLGVTAATNRTPAEKLAMQFGSERVPGGAVSDAQEAQRAQRRAMVNGLRSGHLTAESLADAVDKGAISRDEALAVARESAMSPLAWSASGLTLDQGLQVWNAASDAEKQELYPILSKKADNWWKSSGATETPAERNKVLLTLGPLIEYQPPPTQ